MKKFILSFLLLTFIPQACTRVPNLEQRVQQMIEFHNKHDVTKKLSFYTDDAVLVLPWQDSVIGKTAHRNVFECDSFLNSELAMKDFIIHGDTVIINSITERNDLFRLAGLPELHYAPGTRIIFRNGLIQRTETSPFIPEDEKAFNIFCADMLSWLWITYPDRPDLIHEFDGSASFSEYSTKTAQLDMKLVREYLSLRRDQKNNTLPPVCLNHVAVVLDSVTYQHLFDSSFLTGTLGNCKTDTITTTTQSYFGKYLSGKDGYLEFFSTEGHKNASMGEVGMGFITFRTGDIWRIRDDWQRHSTDYIAINTNYHNDKGKQKSWYHAIFLGESYPQRLNVWLMENTLEELKSVGFSDADMEQEIPWETYRQKRSGKTFTKLFDRITSVHLSLSNDEFEYLRKTLTGLGLHQTETTFSNEYVKVTCDITSHPIMRVRTITLALNEIVAHHRLIVSNHLVIELEGMTELLTFD